MEIDMKLEKNPSFGHVMNVSWLVLILQAFWGLDFLLCYLFLQNAAPENSTLAGSFYE